MSSLSLFAGYKVSRKMSLHCLDSRHKKGRNSDLRCGWFGGARRDRTADLYNAIVALSQLSYSPLGGAHIRAQRHPRQGFEATYIAFPNVWRLFC